jgi:hypothetical protein
LLKTDQFFHIDDGILFFALLVTLKFATHANTLQRAVGVAVAAKLANFVILQTLFG